MPSNTHLLRAVAWMMGALLSFTVMSVSVRELSSDMHAFEMLFIRSAIGLAILSVVISFKGWRHLRSNHIDRHLLRNVIHFCGQVLWIFGVTLLPLATVTAIEFTAPLWAVGLALLFLGERMNKGRWVAVAFGFLGILVVLRPGLIEISEGVLIMLGCAFCFGATSAVTKWLTRSDATLTIIFYMVLLQTLFGAVTSIFVWQPVDGGDWPWLLLLAVTGLFAHYALTRAISEADATFVLPFEYLKLPLLAVIGFVVYAEPFEPMILLGALLIFSGNTYSLRYESRATAAR